MGENQKTPKQQTGSNEELLRKIKVLEEALESIDKSQKQKSLISFIGFMLVLLGLIIFFVNLKSFAASKLNDNDFQDELIAIVQSDLKEVMHTNPNVTIMQQDLKKEVLPYVAKQIIKRFKQELPKFKFTGEKFSIELKSYLDHDVKAQLIKALTESLVDVEGVLKEEYPNMPPEELEKVIAEARHVFVLKITDIIEKKIAYVSDDLASLKASINNFKNCEEYTMHDASNPHTLHAVKIEMVEAMLELVIYQLNEEKGQRPVEPLTGGAK